MLKQNIILISIAIALIAALAFLRPQPPRTQTASSGAPAGICPKDTRQCPDGTIVGRVPPACEFAACKPSGPKRASLPLTSGIRGIAMAGSQCTADGRSCNGGQPFRTTVVIRKSGDMDEFARVDSDAAGKFEIDLLPGVYFICPNDDRTQDTKVRVMPGGPTDVVMHW